MLSLFKHTWLRLKRKFNCKHSNIFRYLQWMFRACDLVYVSLETIAHKCGCSIRTAQRALDRFIAYGWIFKTKCPYMSNEYLMPEELKSIDLDDPQMYKNQSFKNGSVHQCVHVLGASMNNHESVQDVHGNKPKKEEKQLPKKTVAEHWQELPRYLQVSLMKTFNFDHPGAKAFIKKVPENAVEKAKEDMAWYRGLGKVIKNPLAFFLRQIKYHS